MENKVVLSLASTRFYLRRLTLSKTNLLSGLAPVKSNPGSDTG